MKTIFIDAMSALQGGGQTYLRNLFAHYVADADTRVIVLAPARFRQVFADNPAIEVMTPQFPARGLLQRALWSRFELPRLLRRCEADVLFCPGGYLSTGNVGRCRTALTFQNMLPFAPREWRRFPMGYVRLRLQLLCTLQKRSMREADLVICISNHGRAQMDLMVPDRTGSTAVIPHGLDLQFEGDSGGASAHPFEYVLYVSILDFYKAQLEVVEAWALLRRQRQTPEKLLLVGPESAAYGRKVRALIDKLGLRDEVILTGAVPHTRLAGYYRHAKVNLFASSCENFPFILIEAMGAGRPVLSSSHASMPEVGGDSMEYFDPYEPQQLADLLRRYLDDPALRADMGRRANARARIYSWPQAAGRTWEALIGLANKACAG